MRDVLGSIDNLTLPCVSVSHLETELVPLELSSNKSVSYNRTFVIDVLTRTKGELENLVGSLEGILLDSFSIYDYNSGFEEDDYEPNIIGNASIVDVEINIVDPDENHKQIKYHAVIFVLYNSTFTIDY